MGLSHTPVRTLHTVPVQRMTEKETNPSSLRECHDCGLFQRLSTVPHGGTAHCVRCAARLTQARRHSVLLSALASALGLTLFALCPFLPLASGVMNGGRFTTSYLFTGPERLADHGAWELSVAVLLTLLVLPIAKLSLVIVMASALWLGHVPRWLKWSFGWLPWVSRWGMVDVFLLGSMIALIRLQDWMQVSFGPALFAFGGVALCSLTVDAALDRPAFWRAVPWARATPAAGALHGCHGCDLVVQAHHGSRCPRCGHRLSERKGASFRRTWAFVATAALLVIPANVWPVMTITKLGRGGPSTILGGTAELAQHGFLGLACLVFVASILVPIAKLASLAVLLVTAQRGSQSNLVLRTRLFRVVDRIGRWSMLDIFATMTLVALARFGWLGNVLPDDGAIAFCGVVLLTLLASDAFDPRLMWDAAGRNPPQLAERAASLIGRDALAPDAAIWGSG
ncbi:MAG: paraquat-inducible protein A [Polyangiaceae bacterium]